MNLKINVEIMVTDVDEDIVEEMTLKDYVKMLFEEDGLDCFILDECYKIVEVEVV